MQTRAMSTKSGNSAGPKIQASPKTRSPGAPGGSLLNRFLASLPTNKRASSSAAKSPSPAKRVRFNELQLRQYSVQKKLRIMSWGPEPLGMFGLLPPELTTAILDRTETRSLSCLSLTSHAFMETISNYLCNAGNIPRWKRECETATSSRHSVAAFGVLLKRLTCLMPTRIRVRFLDRVYLEITPGIECEPLSGACHWATIARIILNGWEVHECQLALQLFTRLDVFQRAVNIILCSEPGSHPRLEMQFRHVARDLLLKDWPQMQPFDLNQIPMVRLTEDSSFHFWLTQIFASQTIYNQARLIYLLLGPTITDDLSGLEIVWWSFGAHHLPDEPDKTALANIGYMFRLMLAFPEQWKEPTVGSIIEELICLPEGWLIDNVALVSVHSDPFVGTKVLYSRGINGRYQEFADIFCALLLAEKRLHNTIRATTMILRATLRAFPGKAVRMLILNKIAATSTHNIVELFQEAENGINDVELTEYLQCQEEFMNYLLVNQYE